MSKAIEEIGLHEEARAMLRVADFQQYIIRKYGSLIESERDRDNLGRDVAYLVQLIYREAQQPLVKQLTDFVTEYQRPLIFERNKP